MNFLSEFVSFWTIINNPFQALETASSVEANSTVDYT